MQGTFELLFRQLSSKVLGCVSGSTHAHGSDTLSNTVSSRNVHMVDHIGVHSCCAVLTARRSYCEALDMAAKLPQMSAAVAPCRACPNRASPASTLAQKTMQQGFAEAA